MTHPSEVSSLSHRFILKWFAAILVGTCVALPVATFAVGEKFPPIPEAGFSLVTCGPMELVVSQVGEVDSADNDILINQCEWSTRILSIISEGSWVEAGDIVAELDSSELRTRLQERAILLVNATAKLADAQEDLNIQKLTNESILAGAELQVRLSKLQLEGYLAAEYPQNLHSLEAAVALAEEDLTRSKKQLNFVKEMVQLGYRTAADREGERINVLKKEQSLTLATDRLKVLRDFTHERTLTQLNAIAVEAQRDYERVEFASKASILRREINLRSRERSTEIYQAYQDRLAKNIAACTIRASKSGEVIYAKASSTSSSRIDEGSSMRYLQAVATIPDRDRLQVKVRVHESNIRLIEVGQPVVIKVDATGLVQYSGHVSLISRVPLSGSYPNYHLREYRVTVDIDADPEMSRTIAPGMTATVNIIAAQRQSTPQVAVQSVVEIGEDYYAFVKKGDEIRPRVVKVGISSDSQLEVIEGLEVGEVIVQKPRVTCAQRIASLQQAGLSDSDQNYWLSLNR